MTVVMGGIESLHHRVCVSDPAREPGLIGFER
jgi:hypothetical protein